MASSVVYTSKRGIRHDGKEWIQVQAAFTCHTDGTFTTTPLYETEVEQTAGNKMNFIGFYLYQVKYFFGTTAVTDNSDLTLLEHSASGRDILNGAGANMLDAAANTDFQPWVNASEVPVPCYGPLYLAITNNIVNGAIGTIIFNFIQ
jgi:hypothetical protein